MIAPPLVLASQSASRRTMLTAAGVAHDVRPSRIDEDALKFRHRTSTPDELALLLAEAKAQAVSALAPGRLVLGSDSVVEVAGRRFDKPRDRQEAAEHLRHFSGREMILWSAAALVRDGLAVWRHRDSAKLSVRTLSTAFIDSYLDVEWPAVSGCVGVFRIEGPGAQLFAAISGSHFTVLGLPLLAVLEALRDQGVLAR